MTLSCCCCGLESEEVLPCGHGYCCICLGRGHEQDHDCGEYRPPEEYQR